eukprot:gene26903-32510_t
MGVFSIAAAVVVIGVLLSLLLQPEIPITGRTLMLGTKGYDIKPVNAPAADGYLLKVLSFIVTRTPFGPAIRRKLLNDNDVWLVREVGSQVTIPPVYYPMKRLAAEEKVGQEPVDALKVLSEDVEFLNVFYGNQVRDAYRAAGGFMPRSIGEYAAAYRAGTHKPSSVIKKTLEAVRDWEKKGFVLFSSILEDDVLQQARESDKRFAAGAPLSVLDGVPVAFKDCLEIIGHNVYNGYNPDPQYKEFWEAVNSTRDDVMVARFRSMGAIIIGLTVMVEGGVSPLGYNSHFQGPFNPFSLNRYSGGSSSGSAVVVATGIVPVAIGFDGGGSVRIPSAMSGIHGLATTYGRVPFEKDYGGQMIKSGPMTASAEDVLVAMSVMSETDMNHFYAKLYDGGVHGPPKFTVYEDNFDVQRNVKGMRVGIYREWFADSDEVVRNRCEEVVKFLVKQGVEVVDIDIPHLYVMSMAHGTKLSSEMSAAWDRVYTIHPDSMEANTRVLLGLGRTSSAIEILAGEKLKAWAMEYLDNVYTGFNLDAIVTPTVGTEVPIMADSVRQFGESNTGLVVKVMKHIFLANFLGLPGYTVPVGNIKPTVRYPSEPETVSVPVGFHLLGNHWTERKLLKLARAIEHGFVPEKQVIARPLYSFDPLA